VSRFRVAHIGGNFTQRLEDEQPFAEGSVGHSQPGLVDDLIAIENQIEIQRPGRTRIRALAAGLALDRVERSQQRGGRSAS
jgi:hypothetical protein